MNILLVLATAVYAANSQILPHFGFDRFSFPSGFGIFPNGFNFPRFPDFFGFDWGRKLEEKIITSIEKASKESGISRVNGTTIITQTIEGKKYTVEIPQNTSYALRKITESINGTTTTTIKLTINGTTAVYTTANGTTTVTDDKGNPLIDRGFFEVVVTDIAKTTPPDITPKASKEPRTAMNTEEQQTTHGSKKLELATQPVSTLDTNDVGLETDKKEPKTVTRV